MKNKIAVVISDYYKEITNGLTDGFNSEINKNFEVSLYYVTGAWEILYKINALTKHYDKFVAVGAIVKGETDHYDYISSGVTNGLVNLTINKDIYISNCVLNVHHIEDATNRSKKNNRNKGIESAKAINNLFS
uniref:6,7-dimethyl-8-ribityllumazine synthase n=1 Tax=Candidatus Actinomarina minuta TaxID=1389454 RepID=S5DQM8_9ACTN|nr:riboflavin synthase beta-chain [Candidatus Actinomarina minuta]